MGRSRWRNLTVLAILLGLAAAGLGAVSRGAPEPATVTPQDPPVAAVADVPGSVVLAFVGDAHFEGILRTLPFRPGSTLGALSRELRAADLALVNLESALGNGGRPARKEREAPGNRYWFRSPPDALGVFERSGIDVVTMANNHGADYGRAGLHESLAADADSPVAVVGIGRDPDEAYAPERFTANGTEIAVLAADATFRESAGDIWAVAPGSGPGVAAARSARPARLLSAVRDAAASADVVVVYLHWGDEYAGCPTQQQRTLAAALSEAGADVIVGTHAHVLLGSGMLGDTYVSYGLGSFLWYHGSRPETGVLRLRITGGRVVQDEWLPALVPRQGGRPKPLTGAARAAAVRDWRALRACTGLDPVAPPADALPAYTSSVVELGQSLRRRMSGVSHRAGCPVGLDDLRLLRLRHVDFQGRPRIGRLVVHADVARDVASIFERLYRARFPIARMRLVEAYAGNDERSMAANNTSGFNCRRVAGEATWSDHAYGRAIDLNPVQNPYVTAAGVQPLAGQPYVGTRTGAGVIRADDVVTRAFAAAGWTWGGLWAEPDFQHFAAP